VIDSHTHLDLVPAGEEQALAAARAAGVRRILTIGMDEESWAVSGSMAERHDDVFFAAGRHPNHARDFGADAIAQLRGTLAHPRCLAVGETGLDYHWDAVAPAEQAAAFHAHIDLAREAGLPLVVHTREAAQDTVATLAERARGLTVVLHCFSMPERLDECLEAGWWISFAGNVTYPRNTDLADAAARVPLDRLLVETDAPYLTPQPVRKHRNQPAFVVHTARFVAERRGISYEALETAVDANAAAVFGW
jgi:TatD DNase family protein